MRALKNWTITVEAVKKADIGFVAYVNYLSNQYKHKNQTITRLTNMENIGNIAKLASIFNIERKLNGGGRPSNYAWSAVLSYPFAVPDDILNQIYKRNAFEFLKFVSKENNLGYTNQQIVVLVENNTIAYTHKGKYVHDHIHIIFPKHFEKNGEIISVDLTKKKYSHRLKLINNQTVLKYTYQNHLDYTINSHKQEQKQELNDEINTLLKELRSQIEAYEKSGKQDKEELKRFERIRIQLKNGNTKRAKRTLSLAPKPKIKRT